MLLFRTFESYQQAFQAPPLHLTYIHIYLVGNAMPFFWCKLCDRSLNDLMHEKNNFFLFALFVSWHSNSWLGFSIIALSHLRPLWVLRDRVLVATHIDRLNPRKLGMLQILRRNGTEADPRCLLIGSVFGLFRFCSDLASFPWMKIKGQNHF